MLQEDLKESHVKDNKMATLNQKRVFERVSQKVVKGMPVAISKEMRGIYKNSVANRPNKLTRSKGWQELLNEHLPDSLLAKRHRELLNKREISLIEKNNETGEKIYEKLDEPDTQAVSKGLDMAYKLKGRYPKENGEGDKTLIINITGETARRFGITSEPSDSSVRST